MAVAVFCFAAYNLFHIYTEYKKGTDEYNYIEQMAVTERDPESTEEASNTEQGLQPPFDVDFAALQGVNPDVVGWIYIEALDGSVIRWYRGRIMRNISIPPMRIIIILREPFLSIMRTAGIFRTAIRWCTDTI